MSRFGGNRMGGIAGRRLLSLPPAAFHPVLRIDKTMEYSLGLGVLVLLVYGVLHAVRKRIQRRRHLDADIPVFLAGGDYPANGSSSTGGHRTEVFPCPKVE